MIGEAQTRDFIDDAIDSLEAGGHEYILIVNHHNSNTTVNAGSIYNGEESWAWFTEQLLGVAAVWRAKHGRG